MGVSVFFVKQPPQLTWLTHFPHSDISSGVSHVFWDVIATRRGKGEMKPLRSFQLKCTVTLNKIQLFWFWTLLDTFGIIKVHNSAQCCYFLPLYFYINNNASIVLMNTQIITTQERSFPQQRFKSFPPATTCFRPQHNRLRLPGVVGWAWLIGSSADRWVCVCVWGG